MTNLWIIEARTETGALDLKGVQPCEVFGMGAINGITENAMARVVFRKRPDLPESAMTGLNIPMWPSFVDPRFKARRKTWR